MNDLTSKNPAGKFAAPLLAHFARGSLLALGILATAFLLARAGIAVSQEHDGTDIAAALFGRTAGQQDAAAPAPSAAPAGDTRAVVDYLSRKYRVAAAAIEPLIRSALEAGEHFRVDPMLIVAVMAVESGFNPIAESPMGAQGLMQVIPRFHQDKLEAVGENGSLLDPVANIRVGTLVLKEYIRRAGSLEAGLQQYAGAANDDSGGYAAKVLAEKQRIESAASRGRQNSAA
ncbi:MAG TPA: transglycosylase SLT domain-containing protein [Candidatus Desulfobacillus sp.]|nr:transglycosylase SLT domain-containing protein [Candidatus Desulfobacillus sp.]